MANYPFTLSDERKFPNGTSVAIYPVTNWPRPVDQRNPTGAPVGSSTASGTVSAGSVTFSTVPEGDYQAYASVGGVDRYEKITVGGAITGPYIPATALDTDGTFAANSDARVPSEKAAKTYADSIKLAIANTQTNTYTLVLTDAGLAVEMNAASAKTITVPPNSSVAFAVGTVIELCQIGAGQLSIAAGGGVTIDSPGARLKLTTQYSTASLRKRGTDEWVLAGDLTT